MNVAPAEDGLPVAATIELLDFVRQLGEVRDLGDLQRRFVARAGGLLGAPMYGFDLVEGGPNDVVTVAAAHVSDVFLARYGRDARGLDPVRARGVREGVATCNTDLMSEAAWLASDVFRAAYHLHEVRYVIEAPLIHDGELLGSLTLAESDPARPFAAPHRQLAAAVADVLAGAVVRLRRGLELEAARARGEAALRLARTAVATSDPARADVVLNASARRLADEIVGAEERIHRLLAMGAGGSAVARRVAVQLADGSNGVLHGHSAVVDPDRAVVVTVLELERAGPAVLPELLEPLTRREAQVARLVIEGLADRVIAERLCLSSHTVNHYVKRVYRKLGVDSRVALTRLLLCPPTAHRTELNAML